MSQPKLSHDEKVQAVSLPQLIAESVLVPQMKANPQASPEEMARRMYKAHRDLFNQAIAYLIGTGKIQSYHATSQKAGSSPR